jgi:murein L,D-transpeptidase YafK
MKWVPVLCAVCVSAFAARGEDRVKAARQSKGAALAQLFARAHVAYPPAELYLRVFKQERELELWAGPGRAALTLIKTFRICAVSGTLGPKREEGDGQIPEGFYEVARFNPQSNFHLALGIDYPNASDRRLGRSGHLGGDIMIHGNCVTVGCIPLEDDPIEEVYLTAVDARAQGQKRLPVHIFPARLDAETGWPALVAQAGERNSAVPFWRSLQPAYLQFERTHRVPDVTIDAQTGAYRVRPER